MIFYSSKKYQAWHCRQCGYDFLVSQELDKLAGYRHGLYCPCCGSKLQTKRGTTADDDELKRQNMLKTVWSAYNPFQKLALYLSKTGKTLLVRDIPFYEVGPDPTYPSTVEGYTIEDTNSNNYYIDYHQVDLTKQGLKDYFIYIHKFFNYDPRKYVSPAIKEIHNKHTLFNYLVSCNLVDDGDHE